MVTARKKDYLLSLMVLAAMVLSLVFLGSIPLYKMSTLEVIIFVLTYIAIILLHEVVHYIAIKALGREAKIRTLLRFVALTVEYDRLAWNEYIAVAIAPLLVIQLPLTVFAIATSSLLGIALAGLHMMSSIPDVVYSIRVALLYRGCYIELYKEKGKIKGYVVKKPLGEEILYEFV